MDEKYLDQLLKNAENGNSGIPEVSSGDALYDMGETTDVSLEERLSADAKTIRDVAWSDSEIPMEALSELDELDEQADLDMDEMDFDDIDFDDLDVTSMNVNPNSFQKELEDINALSIEENYLDESIDADFEREFQQLKSEAQSDSPNDTEYINTLDITADTDTEPQENAGNVEPEESVSETDTGTDIDSLFEEVFGTADTSSKKEMNTHDDSASEESIESTDTEDAAEAGTSKGDTQETDDMNELFSMLGLEGNSEAAGIPAADEIPDFEIPPELAEVEDIGKAKKKKGFMDILFGEEEDDEPTPEELAELARKKEEKQQAKQAKKEEKKAKKAESDAKKKTEKEKKTAKLTARKAEKKAEEERILEKEGPDKKLNKVLVTFVMLFFLAIGGTVILGTSVFDYSLVISKATDYFERQRYGMAYREILGVEVKEKDQELKDKIYTVMYVERQYEAYENYVKMNRPDLALDALLQGLDKYDEYYDDAVELGIVADLEFARTEILQALTSVYGLSETEAKEILLLESAEYTTKIQSLTMEMGSSAEAESAGDQ